MLSGDMLRNSMARTVNDNRVTATNSTRKDRIKAWITHEIEPWVVFSPKNTASAVNATNLVLREIAPQLVIGRDVGNREL